ncbi:unnamed protein product [Ectocarpus sp. CCAP 1310/34]|nr:unnamed protein product [Ectocarpus sp. CCAP 1310/34]
MAHGGAVSFASIAMIAAWGRRRTRVQGLRHCIHYPGSMSLTATAQDGS